ncbi:MAG: hydrogenase maturation protease [Anaerolineales bacterium]|nr:hydrogenase maturation protease [Anaerolineales bacterium]
MSKKCWQQSLNQALHRRTNAERSLRVAFVGIGNELCGDDAAGVQLARELKLRLGFIEDILVISAGSAPENCTGSLRRFAPDLVILLDAAQMGEKPGTVRWIPWHTSIDICHSTHTLPLNVIASCLIAELGCEVGLLGIQPLTLDFGDMTPILRERVNQTARAIAELILDANAGEAGALGVHVSSVTSQHVPSMEMAGA